MTDKPKRGGKRPGAGAKPSERGAMVNMTIRVYVEQKAHVECNGGPELVRGWIDEHKRRKDCEEI
jgi:hypothetical protein